jgi:hypothetical protein
MAKSIEDSPIPGDREGNSTQHSNAMNSPAPKSSSKSVRQTLSSVIYSFSLGLKILRMRLSLATAAAGPTDKRTSRAFPWRIRCDFNGYRCLG